MKLPVGVDGVHLRADSMPQWPGGTVAIQRGERVEHTHRIAEVYAQTAENLHRCKDANQIGRS